MHQFGRLSLRKGLGLDFGYQPVSSTAPTLGPVPQ